VAKEARKIKVIIVTAIFTLSRIALTKIAEQYGC
jgi:hypothetical protein